MDSFYQLAFSIIVPILSAVVLALILLKIRQMKTRNCLIFDVRLHSKEKWDSFDPELYLQKLSGDKLTEALNLFDREPSKDKLMVRWTYSDLLADILHQDTATYPVDAELEAMLRSRS